MQTKEIRVTTGRTFNHPYESYSNFRPGIEITAALTDGDDPEVAIKELQAKAERIMEEHKESILQSLEQLRRVKEASEAATRLEEQIRQAQQRLDAIRRDFPNTVPAIGALEPDDADIDIDPCEVCIRPMCNGCEHQ